MRQALRELCHAHMFENQCSMSKLLLLLWQPHICCWLDCIVLIPPKPEEMTTSACLYAPRAWLGRWSGATPVTQDRSWDGAQIRDQSGPAWALNWSWRAGNQWWVSTTMRRDMAKELSESKRGTLCWVQHMNYKKRLQCVSGALALVCFYSLVFPYVWNNLESLVYSTTAKHAWTIIESTPGLS